MQQLHKSYDRRLYVNPAFLFLLFLLFFIQMETTLLGRAYTHIIGLNAAGQNTSESELVTLFQALCLATILMPLLIAATSKRLPRRRKLSSYAFIRWGLGLWLCGAVISTLAHRDDPSIILNAIAGIGSGAAVFFAVRRVRFRTGRQIEAALAAIAVGAVVPAAQCIMGYYRTWGAPSVALLLDTKNLTGTWQTFSPFGNPDHIGSIYVLLACPFLGVVFTGPFGKATRWMAWGILTLCCINLVLSLARTALVIFALAILLATVFVRNRWTWITAALVMALVIALLATGISPALQTYFGRALRYDVVGDASARLRVESMLAGWQHFLLSPVVGVGAFGSIYALDQTEAHQFAIWQATEHGILGFLGVVMITVGCVARLLGLLKTGPACERSRLEFVFLLGPALYFVKGAASDIAINTTVVNTWICSAFALLGVAEGLSLSRSAFHPPMISRFAMGRIAPFAAQQSAGPS
jgi:hypothetical protein